MNFRVSRQYSDLSSNIITEGVAEKDVRAAAQRGRVAEVSAGMTRRANDSSGEWERDGRFILLNVKFHVGTQL